MWISKKKWQRLEKRIADLEREIQSQQDELQNIKYESATDLLKELEEKYRKVTSN